MNDLSGKTILITGATFGIGEALSRHLMQFDVHLILVARTTSKLVEMQKASKVATVVVHTCDFYNEEDIRELCNKLRPISIDYFVSNAGKSMMRSLAESADRFHDFKRTMAVNYLAPVQLICGLLENFKRSRTHIVNVSTYNVLMKTPPRWSAYVSSKKAMHSWFESNKPELAINNISVSNLYLPLVESRMKDANKTYQDKSALPMNTAIDIIVKALYKKNYNFFPWWHAFAQVGLFVTRPFWNIYWRKNVAE
jgi:short-subunit dehydrogenase